MSKQASDEFSRLVTEYRPKIYRLIHAMVQDRAEAEDLTQETLIKIYQNLPSLEDQSKLSGWIYRIATNLCRDRFRQSSCRQYARTSSLEEIEGEIEEAILTPNGVEPHPTVEEVIEQNAMGECVQELLRCLPEDYRIVIVLHDLEGLKNHEVAQILDCSTDAVKIRLHRARGRLKEKLLARCGFSRNERNVFACEPKREPR
ncbi:MAG: RNA polymerase sigma factor [Candidatus Tectomicrobia bacterium]|uniref:RNA polymerase sigma factor n=1 Tax=Tectimicrobiota bacterium TaxID=2528274 RepID=A0A932CPN8_UNCTE|nr:RNA polymerase sigma factor [Candidatus Tectomicrobia bacterium]